MDLLHIKRKAQGYCALDNWGGSTSNEGSSSTSVSGYGVGSTGGGAGTTPMAVAPALDVGTTSATSTAAATVADATVTGSNAAAAAGAATSSATAAAAGGGIASASSLSPEMKVAVDGIKKVFGALMEAVGFGANPVFSIGKTVFQNSDNIGKPNPFGYVAPIGSSQPNVQTSPIPAPNSFAAQQRPTGAPGAVGVPAVSTSYIATRSNVTPQTQTPTDGLAVLAVLATLVLNT